jgi:hypothetical protein
MEFKEYLYSVSAAALILLYKVFNEKGKSARYFAAQAVLAIFLSVVIAPAASEYLQLSLRMTCGLSGLLVLFSTSIVSTMEAKLKDKITNL